MPTPADNQKPKRCHCNLNVSGECIAKSVGRLQDGFYCELWQAEAIVAAAHAWKDAKQAHVMADGGIDHEAFDDALTALRTAEANLLAALAPTEPR